MIYFFQKEAEALSVAITVLCRKVASAILFHNFLKDTRELAKTAAAIMSGNSKLLIEEITKGRKLCKEHKESLSMPDYNLVTKSNAQQWLEATEGKEGYENVRSLAEKTLSKE